MRPLARWPLSILVLIALVFALPASAHVTKLSSARLDVRGPLVQGALEVDPADLRAAIDAAPGTSETDYLLAHARVTQAGAACEGEVTGQAEKGEHRMFEGRWRCPPGGGVLRYEASLFQEIDPASKHMVTAAGDVARFGLLSVQQRTVELGARPTDWGAVLARYFLSGVEHILIGFDHIAFIIAAVVWGRRLWPLVRVVTAFTIAHSITLALAALDLVTLPSAWVEAAIAASIVYVAVENFRVRSLAHRGWVTFAFGLVHGFGFASVLRDYGLPEDALVPALAAFNIGVEAGQIAVVAAALVVLVAVERKVLLRFAADAADPRVVKAISAVIALLGMMWFVERLSAL
jgi:hydrogenase/urease accessory protein HupE